ncbi:hypothetical protein EGW08_013623 [Elysia chlorotica]|uniref:Uncharacterized protein n=1 Tax=Elysia chlorotica TaxID=188477 RepID=A0A3S1BE07_ELYCH|nr:hypothetical protein EGW08_013623 [Elysia chlorotica]
MARSRNQMTTRIDFLLRNMPRSLWEMGKSLDRAVVVQGSGTVMTYTRDQLDSFHPIDEETINAVKRRLKKDKMTAVKQTPRRGTRCRLSLAAEQSIAGNTTLTSYTEGFDPFFGSLDMTIKRKTSYTTSSDLYKI